ncbi:MAG: hypothetical protein ABL973_21095 [Micropepsaceae bacterium]
MNNTKPWWRSKTVWASIIAMLAGIASLADIHLDATLQDELASLVTAAAEVASGAIAMLGRIQAQSTLTWRRA